MSFFIKTAIMALMTLMLFVGCSSGISLERDCVNSNHMYKICEWIK